jgi:hypothetical protein
MDRNICEASLYACDAIACLALENSDCRRSLYDWDFRTAPEVFFQTLSKHFDAASQFSRPKWHCPSKNMAS